MTEITRVVHLIPTLDLGGAETTLARLLKAWNRDTFSQTVVSMTDRGPLADRIETMGIHVEALRMRRGLPDPRGLTRIMSGLRRERPHVLSSWLFHADLLGLVSTRLASRTPLVWNVQCSDLDPRDHPWHLRGAIRVLAAASRYPAAVIVNSRAGRRAIERLGYHPRRWEFIPNGFDTEVFAPSVERRRAFRARLAVGADTPLIGLVARYHPMKDHATFIESAALVARKFPKARFIMAGRGVDASNAALLDLVRRHNLDASCHVYGEVSDTPGLFDALDLAVSSSYSEASPNVIGEAMASGVPCVVTDVGDCADIVGDRRFVVEPRNPAALADAIGRVISLPDHERTALGHAARQRILTEYSLDHAVRRYERLYDELSRPN